MQLAINVDKSRFLDCSSKFNHYLYELKRSEFGPISEMCNIWINKDPRSQFYIDKFHQKNKRIPNMNTAVKEKVKCTNHSGASITLPFRCSICSFYYQDCNLIESHISCENCEKTICLSCRLDTASKTEILKILPQLHRLKKAYSPGKQLSKSKEIPEFGLILNLKSKERKTRFFKTIRYNNLLHLFEMEKTLTGQRQLRIISSVGKKNCLNF